MKKHLIVAFILFVIIAAFGLATNFIRWDETPLEQTIYAFPLGIGLMLEVPFFAIMGAIIGDRTTYVNYSLFWTIIPFIAGLFYAGIYYGIVRLVYRLQPPPEKNKNS